MGRGGGVCRKRTSPIKCSCFYGSEEVCFRRKLPRLCCPWIYRSISGQIAVDANFFFNIDFQIQDKFGEQHNSPKLKMGKQKREIFTTRLFKKEHKIQNGVVLKQRDGVLKESVLNSNFVLRSRKKHNGLSFRTPSFCVRTTSFCLRGEQKVKKVNRGEVRPIWQA